ncbi:MAG: prephenate dehydrogenase [Anaerolineae bacterium]|nr:MAG: prephenate dehydrogenase [Anaerolineae bacterium]
MTSHVAIIGLRQIGASIGLRLGRHPDRFRRVGYDSDPLLARDARRYGALDVVRGDPREAVRGAKLVLLCLPAGELRETMEAIAPGLEEGAVVMDTAPVKRAASTWAEELLPAGRSYLGLLPVFNPRYLYGRERSPEAAQEDLFEGGLMVIGAPPNASGEALRLASELAQVLGASPLYADLDETDGLVAATRILPRLMAAALVHATMNQPGWREGRRLAGRAYAEVTAPMAYQDELSDLREALLLNLENVTRVLDDVIVALQKLREGIAHQDGESLAAYLDRAREARATWLGDRLTPDRESEGPQPPEIPSFGERLQRLLFGSLGKPRKR